MALIDTQTVTVGIHISPLDGYSAYGYWDGALPYLQNFIHGAIGSISDGTLAIGTIEALCWSQYGIPKSTELRITGDVVADFEFIVINGNQFDISNASRVYDGTYNCTRYTWGNTYSGTNPFGTSGNISVTFETTGYQLNADTGDFTLTAQEANIFLPTCNPFYFDPVYAAAPGSIYTSNTITATGVLGVPSVTTDGEYSKNGGAYTSSTGVAANGDTFAVRGTSTTTLNIGTQSATFIISSTSDPYGKDKLFGIE